MNRLSSRPPPTDLARLLEPVWPGCTVATSDAKTANPRAATLRALPNAANVRLLVPADSPQAAATALRQFNDGMTQTARIRKAVVGAALATPMAPLFGTRVDVLMTDSETASAVVDEIRGVFGRRRIKVAVFLGERLRPNRKPVVQILTDRGDVLGYVKVGGDPLTRRLVSNEADVLRSFGASPPSAFRVPSLLHEADVGDARLTVLSPLPHALFRRGRLGASAPFDAVREIAFRAGRRIQPLSGSAYERAMRERLRAIEDTERRAVLTRRFDAVVDASARADVTFGSWHGDWTPWNMSRTRSTLLVWDWERSGGPVPVGFDVLHHRFLFRWRHTDASSVASDTLNASRDVLRRLGVDDNDHPRLLRLYLFELLLRFEEGRDAGQAVPRASAAIERALDTDIETIRR